MQQNAYIQDASGAITRYFSKASLPSQQATLGEIALEILRDGRSLSRKAICTKLLHRMQQANNAHEEGHYHALIGLLFER